RPAGMGEAEPKYREGVVSLLPIPLPGPPPRPQGWPVGPPDFVGVGAQRCGTSWWHRLIVAHPGVSFVRRPYGKELHFFDTLENHGVLAPEEIDRYHLHFPRP